MWVDTTRRRHKANNGSSRHTEEKLSMPKRNGLRKPKGKERGSLQRQDQQQANSHKGQQASLRLRSYPPDLGWASSRVVQAVAAAVGQQKSQKTSQLKVKEVVLGPKVRVFSQKANQPSLRPQQVALDLVHSRKVSR